VALLPGILRRGHECFLSEKGPVAEIACDLEDFACGQGQNRTADTRIFSPHVVAGLCVTIGRYWYLFKRLTAVSAGRFYRFEHIMSYSSGKVVAKSGAVLRQRADTRSDAQSSKEWSVALHRKPLSIAELDTVIEKLN